MNRKTFVSALAVTALILGGCGGGKNKQPQPKDGVFATPEILKISAQIEENPQKADLYFQRAAALHELEEDSLAMKDLVAAINRDSSQARYFSALGELFFEHKDIQGSVRYFKKAMELDPNDEVAHLKLAKMLMFINENQKAFTEINTVLRKNPYNHEAYLLKGMVYKNLNDTNKAISSFQTAVQVNPSFQAAYMQLGLLHAAKNDSIAIKYFENADNAEPENMEGLYAIGMYYQDRKQYERAKAVYKKSILRKPQFADAFFNLGWILMQQDSVGAAIKQFSMVTKIEPQNAAAYYNRGVCYELLREFEKASEDYNQAVLLAPDYAEAKQGVERISKKK